MKNSRANRAEAASLREQGEVMRSGRQPNRLCFWGALVAAVSSPAVGADLLVNGSHPSLPLSASINFHVSGNDLVVTLTNSAQTDVLLPLEILTGVYYDVSGSALGLGRTSAVLGAGSSLLFAPASPFDPLPYGVGGEWEYNEGVTNAPFGQDYAIRSAGLGVSYAGVGGRFPGANLQGPTNVNGVQYGITSALDNPATGNSPVTGSGALIKNQVIFTLSGLPAGFDPLSMISNVQFQYGTTRCDVEGTVDRCVPDLPEPSTILFLLVGVLAHIGRLRVRPYCAQ